VIVCRFLLVSLEIDAILGEVTIRQRRKKLEEIKRGDGLSDAYTTALTRLKAQTRQKSTLGLRALMWVFYSKRPLRAEELCHALGVEMESADLDDENVPTLPILQASCLGLVTVEGSSSTVRLVHLTLQEYLSNDSTLFHSPHSEIAEVCLTYLNFGQVRGLPPNLHPDPKSMPLLEYASHYWGEHIRKGMTENVKLLALRLLDRFDEHISAHLLLLHYNRTRSSGPYFTSARGPEGFTGLHAVAFLEIAEIAAAVFGMKEWDVNAADCMGSTALIWATRRGQEEIAKVLLEQKDIDPNTADTQDGRTPLIIAAENRHEGLVRMLLERQDINPNMANTQDGWTPLTLAVMSEYEEIVKTLLGREGINPNTADTKYGQTPLLLAVERGYESVVQILLEREDTNADQAGTQCSRTPLSLAAECGREGVVKMLLEREDVNAGQAGTQCGRTPLSWAAEWGHEGVVKMLLGREDVNADQAGIHCGRTPLSWAAEHGYTRVAQMLLGEDVNPNTADTKHGRTPLSWAAENGHTGVVKVLLEREDVNPNTASTQDGRTPLSWAAWRGHEGVVKMLLARKDVRTATPDNKSQAPLSLALSKGHDGVAKMLLELDNLDPDTGGHSGQASIPPSGCGGQEIGSMLKDLILRHRRGLQKMYGWTAAELDKGLKVPIKRGEEMARKLVTEMGCGRYIAGDLTMLTLYDMAILIGRF